jgi:hypothetical protein
MVLGGWRFGKVGCCWWIKRWKGDDGKKGGVWVEVGVGRVG